MMYKAAAKGMSADSSSNVNYAALLTNQNTAKTSKSSNIWSQVTSPAAVYTPSKDTSSLYGSTSSSGVINAISENKTILNDVTKSYNAANKTFNTEFKSTMSDLKSSAKAMAATDFNVKGATDKETDANVSAALKNVNNFVKDYNDAVSLFSDYSGLGKRLSNMSSLFADNSARSSSLNAIGIKVDGETGKLSVDTEKLTQAMKDTPSRVEYQLGDYGMAGKTESKINVANSQKDQLFPSLAEMAGDSYTTSQALYTGNALAAMNRYSAIGNFMDMYF